MQTTARRPLSDDHATKKPASEILLDGMSDAVDPIAELRLRASALLRERPELLPAATGAVGFAAGVLVGSKLLRTLAVGAVVTLAPTITKASLGKVLGDLERRLTSVEPEHEDA